MVSVRKVRENEVESKDPCLYKICDFLRNLNIKHQILQIGKKSPLTLS